jgi:hypothetical protein
MEAKHHGQQFANRVEYWLRHTLNSDAKRVSLEIVMARFLVAVLIGIGLTLVWQSHGEEAKRIVGAWAREVITSNAPSLAWLLPSGNEQPSHVEDAPKQAQVDAAPKQTRPLPFRDITDAEVARQRASSAEPAQQLEAMARDLATVRRSTEQLASKQQELVERIATLQAAIERKLPTFQAGIEQNQPPRARRASPSR